jgi:hypothetical protein
MLFKDVSMSPTPAFLQPYLFDPSRTIGQSLTEWCDGWPHTAQPDGVSGSLFFFDKDSSAGKGDDPRFEDDTTGLAPIETPLPTTLPFEVEFRVPDVDDEDCACTLFFGGGFSMGDVLSRR